MTDYFADLKKELACYVEPEQIQVIEQAYLFAYKAHHGQFRQSGESYITHPVAAAMILAQLRMDTQSIMAALLHDVLEDTPTAKQTLIELFSQQVADLVDGVSKLRRIEFQSRAEAQAENFQKMLLAMVQDIRVILVKLADRLHNMRTLSALKAEKRKQKAIETLEIYAPLAYRLGMHSIYIELEDLGFQALYPWRHAVLHRALEQVHGHQGEILETIVTELKNKLGVAELPFVKVVSRQKHIYGIYKKMRHKHTNFSEVMDVYGIRIVVDTIDKCYRVLGVVHSLYKPALGRFKDYIAIPKVNNYQSLHTTLYGPYRVPIEVQIRTEAMEQMAENGIAAHWLYKATGLNIEEVQIRAHEWLKSLIEMQRKISSPLEFLENVKVDLFPDEVYVFTPKGDILKLPRHATVVDFAYAVHSDIGSRCVAAKINKQIVPLSAVLENGQQVEIITSDYGSPNAAWLNFVVTSKARSNIKHAVKTLRRIEAIDLGKRLLSQALQHQGKNLDMLTQATQIQQLQAMGYQQLEDLYANLGTGQLLPLVVAKQLLQTEVQDNPMTDLAQIGHPLLIHGTEGVVVRFATCCRPIPGDVIIGYVRSEHGLEVHTEYCPAVQNFRHRPDQFIYIRWAKDVVGEFKVDLVVEVENQRRVLASLASTIADADSNIDDIVILPGDGRTCVTHLTITVRNRQHLARIMRSIRSLKSVVYLSRKKYAK